MHAQAKWILRTITLSAMHLAAAVGAAAGPASEDHVNHWEWCGWGGGGFYWSSVFHPTRPGVIYMGGDVTGAYKTEDHGKHWRLVNNGLVSYEVYSLAVDRKNPDTVFAATPDGLSKSTDAGEHWQFVPKSGPKDLRITAERGASIRAVAVDPSNGDIVYAGSPGGKVYKSSDGGMTWKQVYQIPAQAPTEAAPPPDVLRVQYGGISETFHGGMLFQAPAPPDDKAKTLQGIGFSFKGNGVAPHKAFVHVKTSDGAMYTSKNLHALFEKSDWQNVWLPGDEFTLDGAANEEKKPDWGKIVQVFFDCVEMDNEKPSVAFFGTFFLAPDRSADLSARVILRDFAKDKTCVVYANAKDGSPPAPKTGTIYSVAVSAKEPALVLAATEKAGVVMSEDGGQSWRTLDTPKYATSVALPESDPNVVFGTFGQQGIWKSVDRGRTWAKSSEGLPDRIRMIEVAVSPASAQDVYAVGEIGWGGHYFLSNDGGKTWLSIRKFANDPVDGCPAPQGGLSRPTNLSISPANAKELFISGNWGAWLSDDGGRSWNERQHGADISCTYDIRFQGNRVYASVMDEGTFVSLDNGKHWRQIWPQKYDPSLAGHNWRLLVADNGGKDRLVVSGSPWDSSLPNFVIVSEDGGANFKVVKAGLPDYRPLENTMWGMSYPRAVAADPTNPKVIYLGMDGNAAGDRCGGGIFKSTDGGYTWQQLPHQPGSRRMFFGLAVDPTDNKRLYWGACGEGGGLWRSDDGGDSWRRVFGKDAWVFNVLVLPDGTVYCPDTNLWKSTDHGKTWQQVTHFTDNLAIVALEYDASDPRTVWFSKVSWGGIAAGGVYKTIDGGATWQEITGDLPYRKPMVLRLNPATRELWAAGVGEYKIKQ